MKGMDYRKLSLLRLRNLQLECSSFIQREGVCLDEWMGLFSSAFIVALSDILLAIRPRMVQASFVNRNPGAKYPGVVLLIFINLYTPDDSGRCCVVARVRYFAI